MSQQAIEVILAKQYASYLVTPVFLVDPAGDLLYYNEAAERLLGRRFDETGAMSVGEWTTQFRPADAAGRPLPASQIPLIVALEKRIPCYGTMRIEGADGVRRTIAVAAIPVEGEHSRFLGAMAYFWEDGR